MVRNVLEFGVEVYLLVMVFVGYGVGLPDNQNPGSSAWLDTQFSGLVSWRPPGQTWSWWVSGLQRAGKGGEWVMNEKVTFCFLSAVSLQWVSKRGLLSSAWSLHTHECFRQSLLRQLYLCLLDLLT